MSEPTTGPTTSRRSPQTLSVEDRRVVAAWAADCAEDVLALYEPHAPGDPRVGAAIAAARAFAGGVLDVRDAIRTRGGDAGAAARDARDPAAKAAAYAAEQAAAVAHMGAHAFGAAGYAGKAWVLAERAGARSEAEVIAAVADRQVALMGGAASRALGLLPALGEDSAGPLGPGRLGMGAVGRTIRAVQDELMRRPDRRS